MFSWSSKSNNSDAPAYPGSRKTAQTIPGSVRPPSTQHTRKQHIDSYLLDKTLKPSTRRVSVDDSTYDTVFQTTSGDALILRVRIPPLSPNDNECKVPIMTLVGVKAQHSWLDNRMNVIGYDPISNQDKWNNCNLTLSVVVNTIVQQFQLNPPTIIQITDPGLQRIQQNVNNTSQQQQQQGRQQQQQGKATNGHSNNNKPPEYDTLMQSMNNIPEIVLPEIPSHYNELDLLDRDELQQMLNDELNFLAFRNKLTIFQNLKTKEMEIINENVKTSHTNLDQKTKLKELHTNCISLQESLKSKVDEFQKLENEQNLICKPPNEKDIIQQLLKSKRTLQKESDELATDWIDGDGNSTSVDVFIKQFLSIRTNHHIHAAKAERLEASQSQ